MRAKALTIAGSDPCAGAGIQADLKTFEYFKVYGMTVITAITTQNTTGVYNIFPVPPSFVQEQLEVLLSDVKVDTVKIGMLLNMDNIVIVGDIIKKFGIQNVVLDPIILSSNKVPLLNHQGIFSLKVKLIPLATLITPNIYEAGVLSGLEVNSLQTMKKAAEIIFQLGAKYVLIKGGHLLESAADILYNGQEFIVFSKERIKNRDVHGTGCVLSAAITAGLAKGFSVDKSVDLAIKYVNEQIKESIGIGCGRRVINHGNK